MVEGLVLSSAGALLGLLFRVMGHAAAGETGARRHAPPHVDHHRFHDGDVYDDDCIGVRHGRDVIPGLGASRVSVRGALGEVAVRLRTAAVVCVLVVTMEVALAVVLSIAAGLLTRSFIAVLNTDPGFRSYYLFISIMIVYLRATTPKMNKLVTFYQQLFERAESVPA